MEELHRGDDAKEGSRVRVADDRRLSKRRWVVYEGKKWSLQEEMTCGAL